MKVLVRHIGMTLARTFGSQIKDCETGQVLGTALLVVYGGKIRMIGYEGPPIRPVFLPMERITYWKSAIGFRKMNEVDFARLEEVVKS